MSPRARECQERARYTRTACALEDIWRVLYGGGVVIKDTRGDEYILRCLGKKTKCGERTTGYSDTERIYRGKRVSLGRKREGRGWENKIYVFKVVDKQ